jgi:hypothetical protein
LFGHSVVDLQNRVSTQNVGSVERGAGRPRGSEPRGLFARSCQTSRESLPR